MKLFLIAGEPSGDVHGANLIKELKKIYPNLELSGTGGINLKEQGQKQYFTDKDMSIIGFVEVFKKLPLIFNMFSTLEKKIVEDDPDAVILVDYPGFNLRMAKKIKKLGRPVIYLVSPQFWVWNYKRIFILRDFCDLVISIFPFEIPYFEKEGVNAVYVGNPVIDNFCFNFENRESFLDNLAFEKNKLVIGILPGSRVREIKSLMPAFIDSALSYKDINFVISKADTIDYNMLLSYIPKDIKNIKILPKAQYDIIKYSDFLWACSGTVTLESAILKKPMIIAYSQSKLNVYIAKKLSNLRTIGLPNIIADREFLPEVHCIGEGSAKKEMIIEAYEKALSNIEDINQELKKISAMFVGKTPSKTAALEIEKFLSKNI